MEKSDLEDAQLLAFTTEAAAPSEINGRCKPLGYPATNCRDGDKSLGKIILANTISELTGAVVCPTHSLIARLSSLAEPAVRTSLAQPASVDLP